MKKDLIVAVLLTFCFTVTLFTVMPTIGSPDAGDYDPWLDYNDDGEIDMRDVGAVARAFGSNGTAMNKTGLLLELLDKVDSLNASLIELQSRVNSLEAFKANSTHSAFPLNHIFTRKYYEWDDMENMSLTMNLLRTSHVLILFSAEASIDGNDGFDFIIIRACIDNEPTDQSDINLTPILSEELGPFNYHRHYVDGYGSYSFNFYQPSVSAGKHTVKIQWRIFDMAEEAAGWVAHRTLTVLTFPTE